MKYIVKIILLLSFLIVGRLTQAQCDSYGNISVSTNGFENGAGFTQEYVLINDNTGLIITINTSGNFTGVTPGDYKIYAVNYDDATPSELAIGNDWSSVLSFEAMGNCIAISAAYTNDIIKVCDQVCSGNQIAISSSNFYIGGSSSQTYVLVSRGHA